MVIIVQNDPFQQLQLQLELLSTPLAITKLLLIQRILMTQLPSLHQLYAVLVKMVLLIVQNNLAISSLMTFMKRLKQ